MSTKQAVIIIHGIGEQRPMDTLRTFVEAVWETDETIHPGYIKKELFSKPDDISENFELRRLTTTQNKNKIRTDFFEYYWAHMMEGNKLSHIVAWIKRLIIMTPWKLPKPLRGAWLVMVLFLIVSLFLVINFLFIIQNQEILDYTWIVSFFSLFIIPIFVPIIENFLGDVARYLDPSPKNIKGRQAIRANGVKILKKLHESNQYDRIILVGHSLGSVIAYDILTHAWPMYKSKIPKKTKLPCLESMDTLLNSEKEMGIDTFRAIQNKTLKEQIDLGNEWLVSDLVTLGSPLTYADLLLAKDQKELKLKMDQRELPSCPPKLDNKSISYDHPREGVKQLHYAAVFGVTRWTNIYSPPSHLIFGDIISGPLAPLFGNGVKDISVKTSINKGIFSHTNYWTLDKNPEKNGHINELRSALNLLDESEGLSPVL